MSFLLKFHDQRHSIGLIMLVLSLSPFVLPHASRLALLIAFALFCLGVTFVSDYAAEKLTGSSYLSRLLKNNTKRTHFFLLALIAGFILEGFASYLGHLWYYTGLSITGYLLLVVLFQGFAWYFLCILLSYEAFKDILDKIIAPQKNYPQVYKHEKFLFKILLIVGEISMLIVIYKVLADTNLFRNFYFNVGQPEHPYISFNLVLLACLAFFCIFEYIEHTHRRHSLLSDTIHGYLNPLLAILLVSVVLGVYMEAQNFPLGVWVYTNWPMPSRTVLGLPLAIFFLWPVHYVLFLSFYRAFDKYASGIWTERA